MKHKMFIGFIALEVIVLFLLSVHSVIAEKKAFVKLNREREIVRAFMLTDLSLWTEARYTRHPSQTDIFSPFQDYPSSIEHFPAGSIISPSLSDIPEVEAE